MKRILFSMQKTFLKKLNLLFRFITANIRNQMDYTPQAVYWLGGELSQNREFEWTDGSAMSFQVFQTNNSSDFLLFTLEFTIGMATRPRCYR